jgi:transposase
LWQKLYYKHQKSYQRRRLEAIKLVWDGLKMVDVRLRLGCAVNTLNGWMDSCLSGGFDGLLSPRASGKAGTGQLCGVRLRVFKYTILHKRPDDYACHGLGGYVWTLGKLEVLLSKKWGIALKATRIHEILDKEPDLSFQKHYRDYANASPSEQRKFVSDMVGRIDNRQEDEAHIWYDGFSVSTRPQASYGWAEKNSSPTIPSNEKKENATMGC